MALNSCDLECFYTKRLFSRNLRLIKKLNVTQEMTDMLKTRNFVIRHNFFVPTGSSKLPTQNIENEILELSD